MTLEEFINDVLGADAPNYSQEEIESYYAASVGLFNVFFDKWKKEKLSKQVLLISSTGANMKL